MSEGKKGRKVGRNKNKPCKKRYTMEKRWEVNKGRRMMKNAGMTVYDKSTKEMRDYYLEHSKPKKVA